MFLKSCSCFNDRMDRWMTKVNEMWRTVNDLQTAAQTGAINSRHNRDGRFLDLFKHLLTFLWEECHFLCCLGRLDHTEREMLMNVSVLNDLRNRACVSVYGTWCQLLRWSIRVCWRWERRSSPPNSPKSLSSPLSSLLASALTEYSPAHTINTQQICHSKCFCLSTVLIYKHTHY